MKSRIDVVAIALATMVAAGCGAASSPAPSDTAQPSVTPTVSSTAPLIPSPTPATITLSPIAANPLEAADVGSLVSTPDGFTAIGNDYRSDGSTPEFVLSGSGYGTSWRRLGALASGPAFVAMAAGPLGWVAATSRIDGSTATTVLWFSRDGVTWQAIPDQAGIGAVSLNGLGSLSPITAGRYGFAMVGIQTRAYTSAAAVWVSRDGQRWSEATASSDETYDNVLVLPDGFLAVANGLRAAAFSHDGVTWRDLSGDPGSPFATREGDGGLVAAIGATVVILRPDAGANIEVVTGDFANDAGQTGVSWRHDVEADSAFAGNGISAMASSGGNLVVLGYDRRTFAPITWTSTNASAWQRTNLDAATFGGGVPSLIAISGATGSTAMAAVGYRVNSAGDVRPSLWHSDDGSSWSVIDGDLLGVLPVPPTGPCPATTPTEIEDFRAMAPSLWPVCFGNDTLKIRGVTANCGCGGTTAQQGSPSWLIDPLGYSDVYLDPRVVPADTNSGGLTMRISPAHALTIPAAGTYVELSGHFADAASATCRISPNPGAFGPVAPKGRTVAICEQTFVLTGIRTLGN
jgi:hypothetical protein